MLIRLTEVDVYDEEEINISEFPVDDPGLGMISISFSSDIAVVFYFQDGILRSMI